MVNTLCWSRFIPHLQAKDPNVGKEEVLPGDESRLSSRLGGWASGEAAARAVKPIETMPARENSAFSTFGQAHIKFCTMTDAEDWISFETDEYDYDIA